MGFPKISKKIKAASKRGSLIIPNTSLDQYAPTFIPHPKVINRRFGLDVSVFLHKALGNIVSAGEFQVAIVLTVGYFAVIPLPSSF